jgi:hypothetical protein
VHQVGDQTKVILRCSQPTIKFKFHENPFSGSRVVPRGRTDEQTNMTKLTVTFLNLANAPKNGEHVSDLTETFVMFFSELFQHDLERVMNHERLY